MSSSVQAWVLSAAILKANLKLTLLPSLFPNVPFQVLLQDE
jgi:hypothetical protein